MARLIHDMSALPQRFPKIIRLPRRGKVQRDERSAEMALRLRGHLSLLQSYADLMEGVPPSSGRSSCG